MTQASPPLNNNYNDILTTNDMSMSQPFCIFAQSSVNHRPTTYLNCHVLCAKQSFKVSKTLSFVLHTCIIV